MVPRWPTVPPILVDKPVRRAACGVKQGTWCDNAPVAHATTTHMHMARKVASERIRRCDKCDTIARAGRCCIALTNDGNVIWVSAVLGLLIDPSLQPCCVRR